MNRFWRRVRCLLLGCRVEVVQVIRHEFYTERDGFAALVTGVRVRCSRCTRTTIIRRASPYV